ncbi:hypothetical protein KQ313_11705 [Synechococcus sp. CS-1325]|uniref:hypothetical protein n=1 Tax=unclassified Synechococcus TaxID=2626047 RepID=UPI000DB27607|nr:MULTISPECIES: hypothetical protein [unclassified Synechococcus]PZU99673.1 MAG: hypothetical protein DCF24_08610 [Cyanobium sp.]MCT0200341.1 hypothetical protein [Synechococcus sp. CS-1325]MCT0214019.1 hypothetical protein [Synechococcus sp. CS-1326]MCT0230085.1 hypothetical protein [Synechococcus sp. CS-1324]MCT0233595.1 hypothetical protein [Synechococcus sp. CS-1327]
MAPPLAFRAVALLAAAVIVVPGIVRADGFGAGQSVQEKQLYDYGPDQNKGILNTTNPIELMNRIRRGQALDNATDPGDAIDRALRELEVKTVPAGQTPGSAGMKGP